MKGHIRERSPGHWAIVIDAREPHTGKRLRKWFSFRGTKREAQIECARRISIAQIGTGIEPGRITVAEFLDRWLEHMHTLVSPRTCECYAEVVKAYLKPALGHVRLTKLRAPEIAATYAKALESGRRTRTGGLSPRSVHMMHRALSQALKQAVRWQLLAVNPAANVKPPRVERKEMQVLDADATAALLEAARPNAMFIPILLNALVGLRRGEVAALRWRSVDLDRGQLAIVSSVEQTRLGTREKPPKSGRARTVALPAIAIEELRRHRLQQAQDLLRLGVRATDDTHVCLTETGEPWRPRSMTHRFIRFIRSSSLPRVRLHDLRHSHATHLLAANVHPKIVQERLGHADITTTMNLYVHVMPGMQEDAAARVNDALAAAIKRQQRPKG
jgi:integrase